MLRADAYPLNVHLMMWLDVVWATRTVVRSLNNLLCIHIAAVFVLVLISSA